MSDYMSRVEGILLGDTTIVPQSRVEILLANLVASAIDETQVRSIVTNAIAELVDNAPETFDTLKEIADWIEEHEDVFARMYTLTVTATTQDSVTVTGQTVYVKEGSSAGKIYKQAAYNGQPVSFSLPTGFTYFVEISDTLVRHFNPTTVSGIVTDTDISAVLTYSDLHNIKTAADIKVALNIGADLTNFIGESITCTWNGSTIEWDVVDYDDNGKTITLLLHDTLPVQLQFETDQALAYFENGLAAGNYCFIHNNNTYYFTLTSSIPAGGQLRATVSAFSTYESQSSTVTIETGTVSTTEIQNASLLGTTASSSGAYSLNHMDRVNYGSNNFAESGLFAWLNSKEPANALMPRVTKFSRPYMVNAPGFLGALDTEFVSCLDDTIWECSANNIYECPVSIGGVTIKSAPYTVTGKIGLASQKEIFGTYDGVNAGDKIFGLFAEAENADRIKRYNGAARHWWLRSPSPSSSNYERVVTTSGAVSNYHANGSDGVVPACKISKS